MLDRKFVLENADLVKANCFHRGAHADIERFVELERIRKTKLNEAEELNRQANATSGKMGAATPEQRESLKEEGRKLRERKDQVQSEHDALDKEILAILSRAPNMTHPAAPIGSDDQANLEVARGKTTDMHSLEQKTCRHNKRDPSGNQSTSGCGSRRGGGD